MTTKTVFVYLIVTTVNCAIALKCLEGVQGGNCSLLSQNDTRHNLPQSTPEITLFTAKPLPRPESLSMVHEDEHMDFRPTVVSLATEEPKGRSLNFTLDENNHDNGLSINSTKNGTKKKVIDLSDVDLDNDDENEDIDMTEETFAKILAPKASERNISVGICEKGGLTYDNGEKLEVGCDSVCTCMNGKMDCVDRCSNPYFRRGKKIEDPLCMEQPVEDHCCAILTCADTATEPLELCSYKNKTFHTGDTIKDDCTELCTCIIGGTVSCKPRCPPINKSSDRCVEIQDPKDHCCKTVLCDVTLEEHESDKDNEEHQIHKIVQAKFLNKTAIKVDFENKLETNEVLPLIEMSADKTIWNAYKLLPGGIVRDVKEPVRYVRMENHDDITEIQNFQLGQMTNEQVEATLQSCSYKGKNYMLNEEFNDACVSLCVCKDTGVKCLPLDCPTYFGLDVIDPSCIDWETVPANFTPTPPNCCPEKLRCKSNGSCIYEDKMYTNWQEIPSNVTGCQKKCYCEMGKVECQNVCPPVPALPPHNLPCPPYHATLKHQPDDDCCVYWMCDDSMIPTGNEKNKTKEKIKKGQNIKNEVELGHNYNKNHLDNPTITKNETTFPFLGPLNIQPQNTPSKTLGPLVIYENKDENSDLENIHLDILKSPKQPNISTEENHYFNKPNLFNIKTKQKTNVPYQHIDLPSDDTGPYLGPFSPDRINEKPGKLPPNKGKQNKTKTITPQHIPVNENIIPEHHQPNTFNTQTNLDVTNKPSRDNQDPVHIHGKGNPDEILQIINQHPEFANYPPGSILEIHNIPHIEPQKPQYLNPNTIVQPNLHHVPFLPNQPPRNLVPNGAPPGFTLDQILQEINKNHPKPFPQFTHNSQYPQPNGLIPNNGHMYITQQNVPIYNTQPQHNLTQGIGIPGGFPNIPPGFQQPQDEVLINNLEAISAHKVRLAFNIPPVIVGLHGRVEVRYTHRNDDDLNSWELQVFAPPNDLLATPQLEFELEDLKADTEYRIKVTVTLRDLHNTPTSRIYTVRTLNEIPSSTLPPMIPIEPDLAISDINSTWVSVSWRKFAAYELEFIDGIQLRFKEIEGKIYAATPLIHRAVTNYILENLKPNTKYEIGIYFIPFSGQLTELHAEHMIHFTTANEVDDYGFNVSLEITHIKPTNVEITWSGVPYPEDKYVNIYRAIYQSDSGKGDHSNFKVAKRDFPSKTIITDLKPGTRYRLWLEVYLTNGRIKTSNVQDFITKPRSAPVVGATHDKLSGDKSDSRGDYYGPLVIVAILAAIAILSTLVLLLILLKRHSQNKASITPPPRVTQSAYDNPTYKVEIQQETMDL